MKQLSVVPTAWIADQMEEEEEMVTTATKSGCDSTNHKCLVVCGYCHGDFKPTN